MNKLFAFFAFFLIFNFAANAQDQVVFTGENQIIGEYVSILKDETNKLTVDEVSLSNKFQPSDLQTIALELSHASFWLKFQIHNKSNTKNLFLMIDNSLINSCELFYSDTAGNTVKKSVNTNDKFHQRKYDHQVVLFDISAPKDSISTFYLKLESDQQMLLPLTIGKKITITEGLLDYNLFWGILIGLLAVMMLYNLFIFISVRDISYFYYVLYIGFTLLTQVTLSGFTYKYFFPNHPILFNKAIVLFPGLAGLFGIVFIRHFLQTDKRTPKLDKLFIFSALAYSLAIVCRLIGFNIISYRLIDVAAISSILIIYSVAIVIYKQGYRPAKFFLIAWTVFFVGLVLYILRNSGVLPYNIFTSYTMQIGTAFEVTLLSFALADRINILKKEKEKSQEEALAAARENERIISEQNIILEQKVRERTEELLQTNEELVTTLENLKETQTQLVEAEKMASLGQLTAGIAHEINNPINFVTSNVGPLRRDFDQIFEAVEHIESIAVKPISETEKQNEIEEYKDELDYDYLKMEISHLLNGIFEGASRTAEIVKGLRVFSRVDEDDLKRANINDGMDSTLIIMNSKLTGNHIKVEKKYQDLPLIECYPGKLNQVFLNLISNAIDAIKENHEHITEGIIHIKTEVLDKEISITVLDNGIGMTEKTKQKLFDPFYTTKDVGEGTGLGMSIVYNTVKKHNGKIVVNSELNKGTEISIILPFYQKDIVSL